MKKFVVLLALLCTGASMPLLLNAKPAVTPAALVSEDGYADGAAYAADLASVYGYGTPAYNDAIDFAEARAIYNATHTNDPIYWRLYRNGLVNY